MAGTLYLVGTPIGNLGDFSPRAVEVLSSVDFIAAEDTRVSGKLLTHFGIKKPTLSYFEHNKAQRGQIIRDKLLAGENVALVTDAGMPAISDPGEDLVGICIENSIDVKVVPGPSAVISAIAMSGLPTGRFCFEGFLTMDKNGRIKHLTDLIHEKRTMVFYEAPHKLKATLADMFRIWGDRRITLCREITKLYEENIYTTLSEAVGLYAETDPKGEFVLVIEGEPAPAPEDEEAIFESAVSAARELAEKGMSRKDAVRQAAQERGVSKNKLYSALISRE